MSEDGDRAVAEMPQLWQLIHPLYGVEDSEEDAADNESDADDLIATRKPIADYVKQSKKAPKIGRLLRFLNDIDDVEELQQTLLDRDPVTQQSLLQWCSLNGHFTLVEYLVKRLRRGAFSFDPEWEEIAVFNRWEEMRPELPAAAEVAERQRVREEEKARRLAERAAAGGADGDEEEEDEEDAEEAEPMPEDLVYDALEEYHEQWGDRGVGIVKRVGELGVYHGTRLRDGTKEGLGQSLFPNGDCYTGEYCDNQREGNGVYWWANSSIMYTGEWLKNMRHGRGRIVYPDGSRYLGGWGGDKKNGEGCYTYADGSRYVGTWADNEKHGQGRYEFTDGSSYVGSFYRNEFISGEWWLASGTVRYVGNFKSDKPDGAGVFVHRCGLKQGTFQQEGSYANGQWHPGTLKGTTKVTPRLEVVVPGAHYTRVPIEFASNCAAAYGMRDLVRASNYVPLQQWLRDMGKSSDVCVKRIEIEDIRSTGDNTDKNGNGRVVELRIRPHLCHNDGTLFSPGGTPDAAEDDVTLVTLREPSHRLLLLLSSTAKGAEAGPVAVLEQAVQCCSSDAAHRQLRLPTVRVPAAAADGTVDGVFCHRVGVALRLNFTTRTVQPLVSTLRDQPHCSNAAETVLMYAQQIHPDALAQLPGKLAALSSEDGVTYMAVPLGEVAALSSDGPTVAAAAAALRQIAQTALPPFTVAPQRPPTPVPPAIQPRPDLQPLYEAKAAREAAIMENSDE